MHFWIDKRSSYGFGHYQRPGMAGFGYYPRRNRAAKAGGANAPAPHSLSSSNAAGSSSSSSSQPSSRQTNVVAQSSASSASAQHQQGKTTNHHHHHHHHRSHHHHRNQRGEAALGADVELQQDFIDNSSDLDSHHVPVVHSMYPNDDLTAASHLHDTSSRHNENGGGGSLLANQWLPIQIICGLCMILAITLVLLKLYFESYMTGFQVLSLILMSFVLLILTTLLSLLRTRRKRPSSQLQRHSLVESQLQSSITSGSQQQQQTVIVQSSPPPATCEPPPPYALALTLPEKQSDINSTTPPPSYEKINIIQ